MLKENERKWLAANVVLTTDIAELVKVGYSTVSDWKRSYSDWPAPLRRAGPTASAGRGIEIYWWPDIAMFIARHKLPRGPYGKVLNDQP